MRDGQSPGFTLVELLIALSLLSLVMLLLFSGLHLGSRAWETVDRTAERVGELRLGRGFVQRTLLQSRAVSVVFEGSNRGVFAGDQTRLEFAAPLSEQAGLPGLYLLRLSLEPLDDGEALILTRWLLHRELLEGGDGIPAWEPLAADRGGISSRLPPDLDLAAGAFGRTLLLENVEAFEIAYFGLADGDSEPDWHDEWFEQPAPPLRLLIRMTTAGQSWPDLILALPEGQI